MTVKKGAKRGSCKMKAMVTAKGSRNRKAKPRVVTVAIKVKQTTKRRAQPRGGAATWRGALLRGASVSSRVPGAAPCFTARISGRQRPKRDFGLEMARGSRDSEHACRENVSLRLASQFDVERSSTTGDN